MDNNHSKEKLKLYASNISQLEKQKKHLSDEIKETYNAAKNDGFDDKIIRKIIKIEDVAKFKSEIGAERDLFDFYLDTIND